MVKNYSQFLHKFTVEPAFCLYTIVFVIIDSSFTNLLLQKKCRFNCTSEPNTSTACDDEQQGIIFVSEVNSFYRLISILLCSIYAVLAADWSDLVGRRRKPWILLPIIGLFFQSLVGCLHTYFWNWPPFTAAISNMIFDVISGGMPLMTMACMTYMCDVTDLKTRSMGLGLLSAAKTFGDVVGTSSSLGFFHTFLLCAILSLVAFVLALIFIEDATISVEKKPHVCQFFNVMRIVEGCETVYRKNLGRERVVISMLFVIYIVVFFTTQGENGIQYLFLRYKFHWNEHDYSFYVIYRYIGIIMGSVFCSVVLSGLWEVHDGLIGIFAGLWDLIAAFAYLFADQNWHIFIIPVFDVFHGSALTASNAFLSKYYTSEEFGRLQSFLGLFGLVVPICHPAYGEIFRRTLKSFPSAYFILSIILNIVVVLLYWKSYSLDEKSQNEKQIEKETVPMMTLTHVVLSLHP